MRQRSAVEAAKLKKFSDADGLKFRGCPTPSETDSSGCFGIIQTMYLVANAMDLAACAIGGGDSDLFAKVAQTDYYAESTVGEFLIGSKD